MLVLIVMADGERRAAICSAIKKRFQAARSQPAIVTVDTINGVYRVLPLYNFNIAIIDWPVPQDSSVASPPKKMTTRQLVRDLKKEGIEYIISVFLYARQAVQLLDLPVIWAIDPEIVARYVHNFNRN